MKSRSMLFTLFAGVSALSVNAYAAADTDTAAAIKEPAISTRPDQAATGKMHSHVEEKTGIPQISTADATGKTNAAPDQTKHYHPRDGK